MCWAEKCCYFVPLGLGCIVIGVSHFILSTIMTVTSTVLLIVEHSHRGITPEGGEHYLQTILYVDLNKITIDIILVIIMVVGMFWMLFSLMLFIGIIKNKPSLVLSYFSFGILLTIICLLAALLLLLQGHWIIALINTILSLFNIHCLVVLHTMYELMMGGKQFGYNLYSRFEDEECIITSIDNDTLDQ